MTFLFSCKGTAEPWPPDVVHAAGYAWKGWTDLFSFHTWGKVKIWCKCFLVSWQAQFHKGENVTESHFFLLSPPKQYFYCWASGRHNTTSDQCSALRYLSSRKQVVCHFLSLSDQTNTHTQYTYLEKFSLLMTLTFSANNIFSTVTIQVNRVHSGNRRSRTIWESIKMKWPEPRFWKHCKLFPYLDKCSHCLGMPLLLWLVL